MPVGLNPSSHAAVWSQIPDTKIPSLIIFVLPASVPLSSKKNDFWIVGGIDKKPKIFFYVKVFKRDRETLERVILRHVRIGSIIHTDCWKGYDGLKKYYEHRTVNHSYQFVNG